MEKKAMNEEDIIADDFFIISREIDTIRLKPKESADNSRDGKKNEETTD